MKYMKDSSSSGVLVGLAPVSPAAVFHALLVGIEVDRFVVAGERVLLMLGEAKRRAPNGVKR